MLVYKRVAELLNYDPDTGIFRWIANGKTAGSIDKSTGYRVIGIARRVYKASRLAFLLMTKRWPRHHMDHINRVRSDDRWSNLREATQSQNAMNKKTARGFELRGASFHKPLQCWRAQIEKDGIKRHLGYFDSAEKAHAAYLTAAADLHGEFASVE